MTGTYKLFNQSKSQLTDVYVNLKAYILLAPYESTNLFSLKSGARQAEPCLEALNPLLLINKPTDRWLTYKMIFYNFELKGYAHFLSLSISLHISFSTDSFCLHYLGANGLLGRSN